MEEVLAYVPHTVPVNYQAFVSADQLQFTNSRIKTVQCRYKPRTNCQSKAGVVGTHYNG